MLHEDMKAAFADAVSHIVSNISQYAAGPGRDFTRSGKKGADRLISFLVSCGSSSTRIELFGFFGLQADSPSATRMNSGPSAIWPTGLTRRLVPGMSSSATAGTAPIITWPMW